MGVLQPVREQVATVIQNLLSALIGELGAGEHERRVRLELVEVQWFQILRAFAGSVPCLPAGVRAFDFDVRP